MKEIFQADVGSLIAVANCGRCEVAGTSEKRNETDMSKKIVIPLAKAKSGEMPPTTLDREFDAQILEKDYRFTAVLPEEMGQKLRVYCAQRNLKMKHVFAEAVTQFINRESPS